MKKTSILLGCVVSALLAFSVISYARTISYATSYAIDAQQQDPKPVQPVSQTATVPANSPAETVKPESSATLSTDSTTAGSEANKAANTTAPVVLANNSLLPGEIYSATAYSLKGRTASGKPVTRGLIAADPRVLPIGTRVHVQAGAWTGEYVVADTGGSVKGRRIDIWTPTAGEALRFGRRAVKLTILELGGKRAKSATARPRSINPPASTAPVEPPATKQ